MFFEHLLSYSVTRGIISTNKWKTDELGRVFGLAKTKILYEPNAVDVEHFAGAKGVEVRKKLGLTSNEVLVGYVGALRTMGMEKGIENLIEAVAFLPMHFRLLS